MTNQRGFVPILVLIVVAVVILFAPIPRYSKEPVCGGEVDGCKNKGWELTEPIWKKLISKRNLAPEQKACTLEAKICPDGSSVGRTGPNCELAECPADETTNWKTHTLPFMELKLPMTWKVYSEGNPVQFVNYEVDPLGGGHFDSTRDKGKLKLEMYLSEYAHNLEQYVELQKEQTMEMRGDDNDWVETRTTVSGLPAIKVKTSTPGFVIYTKGPINEKVISIAFALDFDNHEKLASQILTKIKLTN